jgi:hypothetical protein
MDGRRTALIVVVDEYEHDGLRDLRAPAADAAELRKVLGDPEIGNFDVRVISNEPSYVKVAVRTAEQQLDFGLVDKDAQPARRTIHLLGPPLARACAVRTAQSRLRVEENSGDFDVFIDTSRPGNLRGEITITGQTGETVIPVHAEISTTCACWRKRSQQERASASRLMNLVSRAPGAEPAPNVWRFDARVTRASVACPPIGQPGPACLFGFRPAAASAPASPRMTRCGQAFG